MRRIACCFAVGVGLALTSGSQVRAETCDQGVVEMSADRAISISVQEFVVRYDPSHPEYQAYRNYIGELKPGQRACWIAPVGTVRMLQDRSIEVVWSQGPIPSPKQTLAPGAPAYDHYLAMVGNLQPGETRFVPPQG